jgi:hypothetical protein
MNKLFSFLILVSVSMAAIAQPSRGFSIVEKKDKKQVDILFNNKLLTAYCYYDSSRKPVLFPVNTVEGNNDNTQLSFSTDSRRKNRSSAPYRYLAEL